MDAATDEAEFHLLLRALSLKTKIKEMFFGHGKDPEIFRSLLDSLLAFFSESAGHLETVIDMCVYMHFPC